MHPNDCLWEEGAMGDGRMARGSSARRENDGRAALPQTNDGQRPVNRAV